MRDPTKATASSSSPAKHYELKKVFFHEVEIREYPQVLGDNPSVSDGAPVAIAWEFQSQYNVNIDVYEMTRAPMRRKGRRRLLISSKRRLHSLIEAGYTAESIGTAIVAVDKARSERLESVRSALDGPTFSGAVQTTGSAILKAGRKGSKMLLGGVSAAVSGIKMSNIKLPRRKSMINPAC